MSKLEQERGWKTEDGRANARCSRCTRAIATWEHGGAWLAITFELVGLIEIQGAYFVCLVRSPHRVLRFPGLTLIFIGKC